MCFAANQQDNMDNSEVTTPSDGLPGSVKVDNMLLTRIDLHAPMEKGTIVYVQRSNIKRELSGSNEKMIYVGPFKIVRKGTMVGTFRLRLLDDEELASKRVEYLTCAPKKCDSLEEDNRGLYQWPYDLVAGRNDKGDWVYPDVNGLRIFKASGPEDILAVEGDANTQKDREESAKTESTVFDKKRTPPELDEQQKPPMKRCKSSISENRTPN